MDAQSALADLVGLGVLVARDRRVVDRLAESEGARGQGGLLTTLGADAGLFPRGDVAMSVLSFRRARARPTAG